VPEISQRASKVVYENPWLRLRVDDVEYPDGTAGVYSVIEKGDFAIVLAAERGGFWLVEQFRYTIGRRVWEFPQGSWPAGRTGSALELARHELREETGHTAADWRHLGRLFTAIGYTAQAYDVFLATDLTAGPPDREPTEQGMVHRWFAEADVRAMIASGQLADAHSVAALALLDGAS
jgi:8-oxo-dGTP pyrophosphatase MutT (NUDIX family)